MDARAIRAQTDQMFADQYERSIHEARRLCREYRQTKGRETCIAFHREKAFAASLLESLGIQDPGGQAHIDIYRGL